MRTSIRVLLLLGILALPAGSARGQRQPFPLGGLGQGGSAMLLLDKDVQNELKLTKEQTEKVNTMQEKMSEKIRDAFSKLQDFKPEERGKKFQEMMKDAVQEGEKLVKEVLKPEQVTRLKQIERQQAGIRAFTEEEIQKALKLTDEQKEKVKTIAADLQKDSAEIMKVAGRDIQKRLEASKKVAALGREAFEKTSAVLNAEQKKAWQELVGEPFELKTESSGFPFQPGKP